MNFINSTLTHIPRDNKMDQFPFASAAATGTLHVVLKDEHGAVKEDFHVKNLVVSTGKEFIASRCVNDVTPVMSHMAVGKSAITPIASDTALWEELGRAELTSTGLAANTFAYVATFLPGVGSGPITEAAVFNADVDGIMLCRTTFLVINKSAADTMTITWNITIN